MQLKRVAATQLVAYLQSSSLTPTLQPGFQASHPTQKAVHRMLSDIIESADFGKMAALALLNLSAAFDFVPSRHSVLTLN
jgi:hypothetical protein